MDEKQRNFLKKNERLRFRRGFKYLFEHGSSFRVGVLKFFYVQDMPEEWVHSPLSIAFAVPKRNVKRAVVRNTLKRRMREAYRQHKHPLMAKLQRKQRNLVVLISYQGRRVAEYREIEKACLRGLKKLMYLIDQKS